MQVIICNVHLGFFGGGGMDICQEVGTVERKENSHFKVDYVSFKKIEQRNSISSN